MKSTPDDPGLSWVGKIDGCAPLIIALLIN
jgi:hypothetical protein